MWLTPMAPTLPALHHTLRLIQAYNNHPSFQVWGQVWAQVWTGQGLLA